MLYQTGWSKIPQILFYVLGSMSTKFILHPGPIVDFNQAYVKYLPFKFAGLFSTKLFITALQFINNCSSVKSILPI